MIRLPFRGPVYVSRAGGAWVTALVSPFRLGVFLAADFLGAAAFLRALGFLAVGFFAGAVAGFLRVMSILTERRTSSSLQPPSTPRAGKQSRTEPGSAATAPTDYRCAACPGRFWLALSGLPSSLQFNIRVKPDIPIQIVPRGAERQAPTSSAAQDGRRNRGLDMAFNPLHTFSVRSRTGRSVLAVLTIVVMFMFVLSSGAVGSGMD